MNQIIIGGKVYDAKAIQQMVPPTKDAGHPTRSTDREANERFVHLKDVNTEVARPNGGEPRMVQHVTGFVRTDKDGQTYASFSECDWRDSFDRTVGRNLARRKWFRGKRVLLTHVEGASLYDDVYAAWAGA